MNADFARQLVEKYGSPLYAYDLDVVNARLQALQAALPEGSRLYYSFKANPLPAIARELRKQGVRAEITSDGELLAAQKAGFENGIVYGGPGKSEKMIARMLENDVTHFSCESYTDAGRLSKMAVKAGVEITAMLRVNPQKAPDARLAMSGVESQFGFDEALLFADGAAQRLKLPNLEVNGVHVYFGTQVGSVEALAKNTQCALETATRVSTALGFECQVVNAGGGFPWPYASDSAGSDLPGLREALDAVWKASPLHGKTQLCFESGRYLCGSSGTLISTVLDVKKAGSKTFVVLDTGIHHLGGMSGLGRIPRSALTLVNLTAERQGEIVADVVGPLCSPLDSLARGQKMPPVEVGDLLAVPNVGAYGLTASLLGFLSHQRPEEVAFRGSKVIEN
ncbi:type III PLP-dependent enzyme [Prosthecobacter sp.]|jgi:diaminopimelate decarboxylase|uniref:type III PLP-dependent enzyme n=1 Tax=Prosthecobacter sp. TaxID=1965333 RepID=UPI0037C762E4